MDFQPPRTSDLTALQTFLSHCGLPYADVESHLPNFLIKKSGVNLVGSVGFESFGAVALFRSLAVLPNYRGEGLGKKLVRAIAQKAFDQGVVEFFLLTIDAEAYFQAIGFETVLRKNVPSEIRTTKSFSTVCPTSALVMHCPLQHLIFSGSR